MRLCRFDNDRLCLVHDGSVCAVTAVLDGVGPVGAGDEIRASVGSVGEMVVQVRA